MLGDIKTVFELANEAITFFQNFKDSEIKFGSSDIIKLAKSVDTNYMNSNFEEDAHKYIDNLIQNETIMNKLVAQFTPVDDRGIMFLGPSGAGKTSLMNAFISKVNSDKLSTTGIKRKYITIFNRVTCIRDTFGRTAHGDGRKMLINECINEPPRILCLVFANSYLQTVDDNLLTRGQSANFKNEGIKQYLKYTQKEEIDWVKDFIENVGRKKPHRPIQDLVIIANKMDLWGESINKFQEVKQYYTQNEEINELVSMLVDNYKKPHFLGVSSEFDSFMKGKVDPVKGFYADRSRFSVLLLRAYISHLLTKKR